MPAINLSPDLGESFGRYRIGYDSGIMQVIRSTNIECGFHAAIDSDGACVAVRKMISLIALRLRN